MKARLEEKKARRVAAGPRETIKPQGQWQDSHDDDDDDDLFTDTVALVRNKEKKAPGGKEKTMV